MREQLESCHRGEPRQAVQRGFQSRLLQVEERNKSNEVLLLFSQLWHGTGSDQTASRGNLPVLGSMFSGVIGHGATHRMIEGPAGTLTGCSPPGLFRDG